MDLFVWFILFTTPIMCIFVLMSDIDVDIAVRDDSDLSIRSFRSFSYHNLLKRGVRITLRAKVNDSIITGLKVVDAIIPVGRGQRQLILGDRYTGKSSLFISCLLYINSISNSITIDGLGSKRVYGMYIGINQNSSKPLKTINALLLMD